MFYYLFPAEPEPVRSVTPSKKASKKTLSELHEELLKKAEGLNLTTPAEQPVKHDSATDSADVGTSIEDPSEISVQLEGSCVDADQDSISDLKSSADAVGVPVDHGSWKCERSKSRKAAKPVKRGHEPAMEFVDICPAQNLVAQCSLCSYTCMCNTQLDVHVTEVHRSSQGRDCNMQSYSCPSCSWVGSTQEVFERHVAHHPGQHTVRYHTCPYCLFSTTGMPAIEAHLPSTHPTDSFRFEVLQEVISYKQKLVECPVCRGLYAWQQDLLCHFRECHSLESLATYMESTFPKQSELTTMSVPKELFSDLLDRYAAGAIEEDTDSGPLSSEKVEDEHAGSWPVNTVSSAADRGTVIRFHCSSCDFNSENFDVFKKHCASHSTVAAADDDDYARTSSTVGIMAKSGIRNTYHCHLCPFECSKMVHYRRHLEIHERNQSLLEGFRCGYCHFAHYRQNCVKFHLGKYHGDRPIKMSRITDGVEVELSETDLYALRSRRGPSDTRSHQSVAASSSSSVIVLRTDKEKRPTNRYESEGNIPLLAIERTSSARRSQQSLAENSSMVSEQSRGSLVELQQAIRQLDKFEAELPSSMIYQDAVKCPRCDFTNRVRVNMIRHLKLHRDEDSALFGMSNQQIGDNGAGHFDMHKNGFLDSKADNGEKPLLRQILSEKPLVRVQ